MDSHNTNMGKRSLFPKTSETEDLGENIFSKSQGYLINKEHFLLKRAKEKQDY